MVLLQILKGKHIDKKSRGFEDSSLFQAYLEERAFGCRRQ